MHEEVFRVRLTHNLKQLKKYIESAISKGAEEIRYDMDKENPYLIFCRDLTAEEEVDLKLKELKENYERELKILENKKFKTHSFRIPKWGVSEFDINNAISQFLEDNKISNQTYRKLKQVITENYDDFDEEMQTVFITEVL